MPRTNLAVLDDMMQEVFVDNIISQRKTEDTLAYHMKLDGKEYLVLAHPTDLGEPNDEIPQSRR